MNAITYIITTKLEEDGGAGDCEDGPGIMLIEVVSNQKLIVPS